MTPVFTVRHELDILLKAGHIQGACCSEQGVYLSHQFGIAKIGWDGKLIKIQLLYRKEQILQPADNRFFGDAAEYGQCIETVVQFV